MGAARAYPPHVMSTRIDAPRLRAATLEPGAFVRHPAAPEWGVGQVQSAIGDRITVNFAHAGKQVINGAVIGLVAADPDDDAS